ncbi:hypothetical protein [Caproicibacter fermentans]|uniref:hypothetical protein n=1 Tax=Caproicibacter fermentans TaxID=2576756 RepID=UPI001E53539D|nr:hypothetical protein [Caproicibacter fermentans]
MERMVRYVKDNFLPGRQFEDLEDLNRQALSWCRQVDGKIHHTTGKIPLRELAEVAGTDECFTIRVAAKTGIKKLAA